MEDHENNMIRFRLFFEDRHLLDKSQRSQGLRHCWFLLKPEIKRIGDLMSQIRECFSLRDRIVLFMDKFTLPTFESTCIITDGDIIGIRKKQLKKNDICRPYDSQNAIKDSENARINELPMEVNLSVDGKSSENLQGDEGFNEEGLNLCKENSVHLDPSSDICSLKRRKKHLKKHLDSKCQNDQMKFENVQRIQSFEKRKRPFPFDEGSSMKPHDRDNDHDMLRSAVNIAKPSKRLVHFDSLLPLRQLPVKGDILSYHYVKPSSSMHPELSSPQVGKVSSFDFETLKIILLPTSDYGILFKENPNGTIADPNTSPYKEDGSLEIELLSLVDVRLLKAHSFEEEKVRTDDQVRKNKLEESFSKKNSNGPKVLTEEQNNQPCAPPNAARNFGEEKARDDDQDRKNNWEEALAKVNSNGPNAPTVEQNNNWAQWVPNNAHISMPSFINQSCAPPNSEQNNQPCAPPNAAHDFGEEKARDDDQDSKSNWEEALAKVNSNGPNAPTAEQSDNWAQWVPNKARISVPSFINQSCAPPNAGRGRGRGRGRDNWDPNGPKNVYNPNRNFIRNNPNWNPHSVNNRANPHNFNMAWSYRAPRFPPSNFNGSEAEN